MTYLPDEGEYMAAPGEVITDPDRAEQLGLTVEARRLRLLAAAERVARAFHAQYEAKAPTFGWATQEASRVRWDDVPDANKALMIAVAMQLLEDGTIALGPSLVEDLHPLLALCACGWRGLAADLPAHRAQCTADDDEAFNRWRRQHRQEG